MGYMGPLLVVPPLMLKYRHEKFLTTTKKNSDSFFSRGYQENFFISFFALLKKAKKSQLNRSISMSTHNCKGEKKTQNLKKRRGIVMFKLLSHPLK